MTNVLHMTTAAHTFQVTATYDRRRGTDFPAQVEMVARTATIEEARELAARFPKSYRVSATTVSRTTDAGSQVTGAVRWHRSLVANDVNGGRNEAGIAAYHKMIAKVRQLGHSVETSAPYVNAYPTREAFESAIA